jgi:hypothetical protein
MRRLALLVCIGLLANLFHAAGMPVQALASGHTDAMLAMTATHDCDEPAAFTTGKNCQLDEHLCCQGLTAATAQPQTRKVGRWTSAMNPVFQRLLLNIVAEPRFKPPRFF